MKDDDDADGENVVGSWYANGFRVGHNAFEFKVDCAQRDRQNELMTVYLRVIADPSNARELFRLLGTSLLHYADRFGPIGRQRAARPERGPA